MKGGLFILFSIFFAACSDRKSDALKIPAGEGGTPSPNEAVATFGEGCFWHTEIVFQSLQGVRDAVSGFSGGLEEDPSYQSVSRGGSQHAETVNVYYDPSVISFETLVKAFFASHDPTQLNRQGNDVGPQYRSIAFYRNETERNIIENQIRALEASGRYRQKVVTEVKPFRRFYSAGDYHQEYILNHPRELYVQAVSIPDYLHFRRNFKEAQFK